MKIAPPSRLTFIACSLLALACSVQALTLGRVRGAALIGRPLDISIPVTLDASDDGASLCPEVDLFHADSRVDNARVSISFEAGTGTSEGRLRVRSASVVDEPVVTLYVRVGCSAKVTRRYVLLADYPSETAAPIRTSEVLALPQALVSASPPVQPPPAATPLRPTTETQPKSVVRLPKSVPAQSSVVAEVDAGAPKAEGESARRALRPESVVRRKVTAPAGRARLKLEPLDLLVERDPTLRPSSELLTPVAENAQARAQAQALWRAINARPEEVLRDQQKLQSLEGEAKALRDSNTKAQANIVLLKDQLAKAESERYANWLVYLLATLVIAGIGAVAYAWYRMRQGGRGPGRDWWNLDETSAESQDSRPARTKRPDPNVTSLAEDELIEQELLDLDVNESMYDVLKAQVPEQKLPPPVATDAPAAKPVTQKTAAAKSPTPAPTAPPLPRVDQVDFSASIPGNARAVNAEELFDIQQQADFFISLGQFDQAIELLKTHISDNVETSALAYLDLMKIYHMTKRREAYDSLREDFNKVFNAQVPVFDAFTEGSSGLDAYHNAMARIEALWPSPKVLEVIEESIFRKPGRGAGEAFDLEAYRELLLLYAMAKDIVEKGGSMMEFELSSSISVQDEDSRPPPVFSSTNIQPLSASTHEAPPSDSLFVLGSDEVPTPLPDIAIPKPSPRLGLDIDLSEPGPPASSFLEMEQLEPLPTVDSVGPHSTGDSRPPSMTQEGGGMLDDFNLFDPATEKEISPRRSK